jgi:hypothetical protein
MIAQVCRRKASECWINERECAARECRWTKSDGREEVALKKENGSRRCQAVDLLMSEGSGRRK